MTDRVTRSLSLIIPVYAEGSDVYHILEEHHGYLLSNFDEFEIIIALDGDDQETRDTISEFEANHENVLVHHSPHRRGKGGAILDAFPLARYPLIAISDADTSITPAEIGKLVEHLLREHADVAIGSRYIKGSRRAIPFKRLILSRFFNILVRLFTGLNVNDTQCGTKVFSARCIPSIVRYLNEPGWAYDVQILYILKSIGARIIEVPIDWVFAEGSRMRLESDIPEMFLSVTRARYLKRSDN